MLNTTSNRVERRMQNDYTSGRWQFEGEVRVSPPTDDESIMQVWGGTQAGATTQMIRAYATGNGTIRKVPGSVVLATNVYGTWVKINVIHDTVANTVKSYVNGMLMATGSGDAPGPWYHKYGDYGTVKTGTAKVEWRNVRHFKDGNFPAGNSTPPPISGPDAGVDGPGPTDGAADTRAGGAGSAGSDAREDSARGGSAGGPTSTGGGQSGSGGAGGSTGGTGAGGTSSAGDMGGAGATGGDDGTGGAPAGGAKRAHGSGGCSYAAGKGAGPALALVTAVGLILLRRRRR